MSAAQRLALQRLARSQDRQEQRQVSSQTSSSSYGAWFTPDVDKPVRRPLTSPSKQIAAQQDELRRCRLSGSSGSSTPAASAAASAHRSQPAQAIPRQAGTAAERRAASTALLSGAAGSNLRGSINIGVAPTAAAAAAAAAPTAATAAALPSGLHPLSGLAQGTMTMVGAPVVAETSSNAYAVCTKEGSLHVNHDRGAAAVLPTEGVALFAMLDGHGQEGAPVSGFSQQNLFGAARAALA